MWAKPASRVRIPPAPPASPHCKILGKRGISNPRSFARCGARPRAASRRPTAPALPGPLGSNPSGSASPINSIRLNRRSGACGDGLAEASPWNCGSRFSDERQLPAGTIPKPCFRPRFLPPQLERDLSHIGPSLAESCGGNRGQKGHSRRLGQPGCVRLLSQPAIALAPNHRCWSGRSSFRAVF